MQINTVVAIIARMEPLLRAAHTRAPPRRCSFCRDDLQPPLQLTTSARSTSPGPGTEVPMPQMGESITEGTITKWLKKVGESVQRDEPLFEISTDKVDAEIPSPVAGILTEIKVPEGATVGINTVVAVIGGGAGAAAQPRPAAPSQTAADGAATPCRCSTCASSWRLRRKTPLLAAGPQDRQGQQRRPRADPRHRLRRPHHQERTSSPTSRIPPPKPRPHRPHPPPPRQQTAKPAAPPRRSPANSSP